MQSQSISGQGRALHHVDPHGRAARSTHSRVRAHVKTLLVATTALVALLAAGGEAALAAVPLSSNSEPVWQPNGVVRAIEPSANGSTAFIGGEFDYVGPYTGSSVQLDQAAGDAAGSWPTFGGGSVHDIVAAPGGGWFVAGSFTTVNGLPRKGVARLTPFGTVDLAFVPGGSGATGGAVSSIEVFDGDVVIAGEFTSYNGSAANIARLDDVTGAVIPAFTSGGTFDDSIKSLATDGTWLYVAGAFTSHGATPTAYLARLAPSGALDTGWLTTQPNNLVSAIAVEGQRLYVGGAFTTMDGVSKSRLAAFDLSTVGDDVDPAFTAGFNAPVEVVHAAGASVYVAGGFTSPTSNSLGSMPPPVSTRGGTRRAPRGARRCACARSTSRRRTSTSAARSSTSTAPTCDPASHVSSCRQACRRTCRTTSGSPTSGAPSTSSPPGPAARCCSAAISARSAA